MTGILNALLGFLRPSAAGPYVIIQTFTSSTTWVCPGGVTEVEYLVVAGGGSRGFDAGGGGVQPYPEEQMGHGGMVYQAARARAGLRLRVRDNYHIPFLHN